ncbi:MAG: toprim domain-containing protein [Methylocystis sp.]|uniref:toprim domain-containing protein n=1 Tax=Methylocystis sp. TaxID=1911079 RepID=UPI003DA4B401
MIIADGKKHRFSVDPKNKRNDAGEYRFYDGEFPGGWAKSHRDPNSYFTWNARGVRTLSDADRARYAAEKAERERIEEAERATAIARVGRRWSAAGPAKNDHPYLTRKGVLAHGLRQSGNTLLVPVYRDGAPVNIQRIFPGGKKLFEKDAPMSGSYFTIGEIGERLIICEGYATGATLFETTGIPVVVAFDAGNLMPVAEKLLELHPGAEIVVAADDDFGTEIRRGFNPGIEAAEKVAEFVGTKEMIPPFDRQQYQARIVEDEDYKAPSDWNDYAAIYGPLAVMDCFFPPVPDGNDPQGGGINAEESNQREQTGVVRFETADEARRITTSVICEMFADAKRWNKFEIVGQIPFYLFSPDVGVGKSKTAIRFLVDLTLELRRDGNKGVVQYLVPNHMLSHEIVDDIREEFARRGYKDQFVVKVIKGRQVKIDPFDDDQKSPKMCAIAKEHEEATELLSEDDVCNKDCPHRDGCPYIDQFRVINIDVVVSSHHLLFRPILKQISEKYVPIDRGDVTNGVAAVVIDEDFIPAIASDSNTRKIAIDEIDGEMAQKKRGSKKAKAPGNVVDELSAIAHHLHLARRAVFEALKDEPLGYVRRESFSKLGVTSEMMVAAAVDEWKFVIRKNEQKDWRLRTINRFVRARVNMFTAIAKLLGEDGPERSGLLKIAKNRKTGHRELVIHKRNEIHMDYLITPKLFIDADLKPELLHQYLGGLAQNFGVVRVDAPYQTVHQSEGRSYAMNQLCPSDKPTEKQQEERKKNRIEARDRIIRLAKKFGGKTLVVTYKAVEESEEFQFDPELNIGVEHFGNIRGSNKYGDARLVVILGRQLGSPASYEEQLGILTGAAPDLTVRDGEFFRKGRRKRLRRLRDGRVVEEWVTTWVHPSPLVDALVRASCVDEITQAIGRGRGVNRKAHEPLDIVVFNDVPLDIPVDNFFPAAPLQTPEEKMAAAGGFTFERPATMALAYPSLWRNEAAAKKALQRDSDRKPASGSVAEIIQPPAIELARVRFQRAVEGAAIEDGAFDPARVGGDPEAALAALAGPVALCEFEGQEAVAAHKTSALADRILAILSEAKTGTRRDTSLKNIIIKEVSPDCPGFEQGLITHDYLRDRLKRHASAAEIKAALDELEAAGLIEGKKVATGKRQATFYRLTAPNTQEAPATALAAEDLPFVTVEDAVIVDDPEPPDRLAA